MSLDLLLIKKMVFKKRVILFVVLLIIIGFILLTYFKLLDKLFYLKNMINDGFLDDSVGHRINEIDLALNYMSLYFPFGVGANKEYFQTFFGPIESGIGFYLGKFGFIGFIIYVLHFVFLLIIMKPIKNKNPNIYVNIYNTISSANRSLIFFTLIFAIYFSVTTDRYKDPMIFYLLFGYSVSLKQRRNIKGVNFNT